MASSAKDKELDPEVEERWSSLALLLVLVLLIFSFWTSYYLKVRRIKSVHETILGLFAGMFVGFIVRVAPGVVVQDMISFRNTIMLNVLLPPIILSSGYDLRQENFFRNFGVILIFAFVGTFISAIVLGVLVFLWSLLNLEGLSVTLLDCLIFGSTLSATDPVTILAIFNTFKVDPKLYSIIFGESILNDAVAIVMFETLSQFHGKKIYLSSVFHGIGIFFLVFGFSMALGVAFGLGCSLMLKHSQLNRYPGIESCLVALIAYTSYFFSNGVTMSGIVSLLFCGITLKHYAYHNMSRKTQRTTKYIFSTLAQLSENFIFIYLGLSLFTSDQLVYKPLFILITSLAVCVARYCAVFPISSAVNAVFRTRGRRQEELPRSYQVMLFWAGLRGAVGFALAAGIQGHNAQALQTTVLVVVVITVIVFGGTTSRMLEVLGIRTGVEDDEVSSEEEDEQGEYVIGPSGPARLETGRYGRFAGREGENGMFKDGSEDDTYSLSSTAPLHGGTPYGNAGPSNYSRRSHFSLVDSSSDSEAEADADDDILPPALPGGEEGGGVGGEATSDGMPIPSRGPNGEELSAFQRANLIFRDGQWWTKLDQGYLIPLFSNSVASRKHNQRKEALRQAHSHGGRRSRDALAAFGSEDDMPRGSFELEAESGTPGRTASPASGVGEGA